MSLLLSTAYAIFKSNIERLVSKISLVSILIACFLTILFFLLPARKTAIAHSEFSTVNSLVLFPIFLFTFNFTPCIQRFARSNNSPDTRKLILGTFIILFFLLMVIISVSRMLTVKDIFMINKKNVDALSYASALTTNAVIVVSSLALIILITSGAFLGTLTGVVDGAKSLGMKKTTLVLLANAVICLITGTLNISVIKMISAWSMPIIVITVFLIPSLYYLKHGKGWMQLGAGIIFISGLAVVCMPLI